MVFVEDQQLKKWEAIRGRLKAGTMPPKGLPQPATAERDQMVAWITQALEVARLRPAPKNGGVRRLTVAQYRNTLKELLQLDDDVTAGLPPDAVVLTPWAQALQKQREERDHVDDPLAKCLPHGVPRVNTNGMFPFKIIQTPGEMVMLYEVETIFRQIFTDGRQIPTDPSPTWLGYSVGHWEGDTLVVDTRGFNDLSWLDARGHGHSEDMRVQERFRRHDFGHLEVAVTVEDPKVFTKPVAINFVEQLLPDTYVFEHICLEDEKDTAHQPGKAGK